MGHFSAEIHGPPGSVLIGNQHFRAKWSPDIHRTITKAGFQTAHARIGHQLAGGGSAAFVGNALSAG
jgi:hypothetical protein